MASQTLLSAVLLFSFLGCGLCWGHGGPGIMAAGWPKWPSMTDDLEVQENPIVCEACTFIVEELQSVLGNDSKVIIALLNEICAELPADYAATCKEYVDEWTPIIVDFLENQTPEEICDDLTLCTAAEATEPVEPRRMGLGHLIRYFKKTFNGKLNKLMIRNSLGNDFLCNGCNQVVNFLGEELTNPQILDELVALLVESCSICPVPDQCRSFYEGLPAKITALVDKYLNNQTCKGLGLCTTAGKANPMDMFSRIFDDVFPDNLDADMIGYRPRPDTEPTPRPHPFRGLFKPFSRPSRKGHDHERRNHSRSESSEHNRSESSEHNHERHHSNEENHEERKEPHHDDSNEERKEHHHEGHDRHDHGPRPGGRDTERRPHRGPIHGFLPEDDFPRPDIRPWWRPDVRPFKPRPWGGKPALPEEPMVPEVDVPEMPTLDIEPVAELINPVERDHLGLDRDGPAVNDPWKHRKVSWPAKGKWSRKQRSIRINTEVNTEDFNPADVFDVVPIEEPVDVDVAETDEKNLQCDMCEAEIDIVHTYLKDNEDGIEEKLMSLANRLCEKLPATTTVECKAEMVVVIPSIVVMGIEYISADSICTDLLKIC